MTDPNGWPDKPGVPANPETPDWHAVLADDIGFAALRWNGAMWNLGPVQLPPAMMGGARYLGRLSSPAEVAALVAAAKAEGMREAAEIAEQAEVLAHQAPHKVIAAAIRALPIPEDKA